MVIVGVVGFCAMQACDEKKGMFSPFDKEFYETKDNGLQSGYRLNQNLSQMNENLKLIQTNTEQTVPELLSATKLTRETFENITNQLVRERAWRKQAIQILDWSISAGMIYCAYWYRF
jgi:hypothetical protein